jgi:RNA polymerase sigma factor (sigma-70 family)
MWDATTGDVVVAASRGDQGAWRELVRRHAGTVWAATRQFRLSRQDAEDVSQTTWLLLAVHIRTLKDPAAIGAWLTTTARRESIRLIRRRRREAAADLSDPPTLVDHSAEQGHEVVLRAELRAAVRSAFLDLPEHCRRLLAMLIQDPPPSYAEISAALKIPRGSIGPTRARCLDRLRKVIEP